MDISKQQHSASSKELEEPKDIISAQNAHRLAKTKEQKNSSRIVVLAEDDEDMRVLLAETLRSSGYEVVEAATGAELFDLLSQVRLCEHGVRPDLVVTDIRMPEWSGLDVLATLRDSGNNIPVILITAFGSIETHEQARYLDALIVLDKPFELEEFEQVVDAVFKGR